MSTESVTMLTVLCDVPNCTKGAQFKGYTEALAAGWAIGIDAGWVMGIDAGRDKAQDYCPSCWFKMNVGIDPNPVILDRALAEEVLLYVEASARRAQVINNDEIQDMINALKEAIEN